MYSFEYHPLRVSKIMKKVCMTFAVVLGMMTMSPASLAMTGFYNLFQSSGHTSSGSSHKTSGTGDSSSKTTVSVPEINIGGAVAAVALIGGLLLVRREKKQG